MLKKILIALAVLIVGFIVVVALQPSDFRVERSATVAAPQADCIRAGQRPAQMGRLVAMGEARSRRQDQL